MRSKLHWTLLALGTLGGTAAADDYGSAKPALMIDEGTGRGGSRRGVSQDYLVLPSGAEIDQRVHHRAIGHRVDAVSRAVGSLGLVDRHPTTNLPIDPQPRLDFHIGTVLSIDHWDLFAELAVVDRGDLGNPATRLPILDGDPMEIGSR